MGAARPSAAGLNPEPSVSQPPAPSATVLEQEAVSSPLHPAGRALAVIRFQPAFSLYAYVLQGSCLPPLKDEATPPGCWSAGRAASDLQTPTPAPGCENP